MARGGREVADAIEAAWEQGARLRRVDRAASAQADGSTRSRAPASMRGAIANREALGGRAAAVGPSLGRRARSATWSANATARLNAETTPDCSFAGCTGCDVCAELGVDVVLAGAVAWLNGEFRLRVRYAKTGRLQVAFASRGDPRARAVESAERVCRMRSRRGFSPHMKVAFGPALAGRNRW